MNNYFNIFCVDVPWSFSDKLKMSDVARGAEANYHTMTIDNVKKIPIQDLADPDGAVLALWTPSSLLQEGLDVMKAWGFQQKQVNVWVKSKKDPFASMCKNILKEAKKNNNLSIKELQNIIKNSYQNYDYNNLLSFNMGRLFRQTHELCLVGTNNAKIYKHLKNKSQRSVSFGENLKHSAKPEHLQDSLDLMFPGQNIKKVEIFARRQRPNWICLGNESPMTFGEDIFDSVKKLKNITSTQYIDLISTAQQSDLHSKWKNI
jgi:N6-adenosine-specific RNA methylase IME4